MIHYVPDGPWKTAERAQSRPEFLTSNCTIRALGGSVVPWFEYTRVARPNAKIYLGRYVLDRDMGTDALSWRYLLRLSDDYDFSLLFLIANEKRQERYQSCCNQDIEASGHRLQWIGRKLLLQALLGVYPFRWSLEGLEACQFIVTPKNSVTQNIVTRAKQVQLRSSESNGWLEKADGGGNLESEKDGVGFGSAEDARESLYIARDIVDHNNYAHEYRGE